MLPGEWTVTNLIIACLLLSFVQPISAHICMMSPVQRGGYTINTPGERSCFVSKAPCGTVQPGSPGITLIGGTTFSVLYQQNLNHYTVGWPGTMSVGWSSGQNQTSDDQFQELWRRTDRWEHWQASQNNYTASFLVPNVYVPVATLQVKYVANKPEEPAAFHQCSDIQINPSRLDQVATTLGVKRQQQQQQQQQQQLNRVIFGFSEQSSSIFFIDPLSGEVSPVMDRVDPYELLIGTLTSDSDTAYMMARDSSSTSSATALFSWSMTTQKFNKALPLSNPPTQNPSIWVGFAGVVQNSSSVFSGKLVAVAMIKESTTAFRYQVFVVNQQSGAVSRVSEPSPVVGSYVNFMWSTFDPSTGYVYVLTGDEDSISDPLLASMWSVSIAGALGNDDDDDDDDDGGGGGGVLDPGRVVSLNVSAYTFQSFHALNGRLYALSPGLVKDGPTSQHKWSVVRIDPKTGQILSAYPLVPSSSSSPIPAYLPPLLGRYHTTVHKGAITGSGFLVQVVYRTLDGAPLLVYVDPTTGLVSWSTYFSNPYLRLDSLVLI